MKLVFSLVLAVAVLASVPAAFAVSSQDHVDRLSNAQLRHEAVRIATHGGIKCATHGQGSYCATTYMKRLTAELVERSVPAANRAWALCVTGRESGYNPAAISTTGDHGVGQINYLSHSWIDTTRITYPSRASPTGWASDVLYSVALFDRVSHDGSYRSPWAGGSRPC